MEISPRTPCWMTRGGKLNPWTLFLHSLQVAAGICIICASNWNDALPQPRQADLLGRSFNSWHSSVKNSSSIKTTFCPLKSPSGPSVPQQLPSKQRVNKLIDCVRHLNESGPELRIINYNPGWRVAVISNVTGWSLFRLNDMLLLSQTKEWFYFLQPNPFYETWILIA